MCTCTCISLANKTKYVSQNMDSDLINYWWCGLTAINLKLCM